ncbi:MAG: hypothetical protein JKX73_03365 [Flavobacteriales bacterium]|nr:hypothetical protein [Flavobacteriales bacterium]
MRSILNSHLPIKITALMMAVTTITFFSCSSPDAAETEESVEAGQTDLAKEKPKPKEEKAYYMLPSPLQIAHIYRKAGLKYFPDVANDPKNVNGLVSETSKLQNLGVYTADLCWVALNKQTQEELTYLKVMMDIAGDIGLGSIFSLGAFMDRFERNVAIEDSMVVILAELQERMDFYMQEAEMDDKSTIIFSGAWIESMYISLVTYRMEGSESTLSMRIQEQLHILEGLISKLEDVYEPVDEIKLLVADLNALHFLINGFEMMKTANKEQQVKVSEISLTDLELDQLTNKVTEIRTRIING